MFRREFLAASAVIPVFHSTTSGKSKVREAIFHLEKALREDPSISHFEIGYRPGERVSLVIAAYEKMPKPISG